MSSNYAAVNAMHPHTCTANVSFIIYSNEHDDSIITNGFRSWTICHRSYTVHYLNRSLELQDMQL